MRRTEAIQSVLENVVNVDQKDFVYNFLKAFNKQMSCLKRMSDADPKIFQTAAFYLLHAIVK